MFGYGTAHGIRHPGNRWRQLVALDDVTVVQHLRTSVSRRDLANPDVLAHSDIAFISMESSCTVGSPVRPVATCIRRTAARDHETLQFCRWSRRAFRRRVAMPRSLGRSG